MNFPHFTKILTATTWQLLGKIFTAGASLLIIVLLGKFLGESDYGDFAKAFVLVEIFYILADFGLNAVFVKAAIDKKDEIYFLKQLILLRLSGSLILMAIIFLLALVLPYNPSLGLGFSQSVKLGTILASATILTYAAVLTAQAGFQLRLAFDKQFIAQSFGSFSKIILVVTALFLKPNILTVIGAVLAGEAVLAILALVLAYGSFFKLRPTWDFAKTWQLFAKAAPIGLSLIFNLFYFRGDLIILSLFRTSAEVGNYSLAYKFFEVSLVLPIFFVNSVYPSMLKGLAKGPQVLKKLVGQYSNLLLLISAVGGILLFFTGPFIIEIIFRQSFGLSKDLLRILALGLPFFYLSAIYMWGLITTGAQKALIPIYAGGAFFNLLLNVIFIPIWGAVAAAVITLVSEGVILVVLYLVFQQVLLGKYNFKNFRA